MSHCFLCVPGVVVTVTRDPDGYAAGRLKYEPLCYILLRGVSSMEYLTPQKVAEVTGGEFIGSEGARNARIAGAVRDNREVKPGNLFVCIRGERADGHDFAASAYEAGAACCLAERVLPGANGPYVLVKSSLDAIKAVGKYHRSRFNIPVIGITGSVGKTTAKEMTAAALGAKFRVLKTQGNLNNELGVPLTLLALDSEHEAAVVEMGVSDFGEMSRLADMVRPDICIITKIGYSHLETLGGLEGVLRAKSEVFAYMKPGGLAIMNGDDELLRGYDPGLRKTTFGVGPHNDFCAKSIVAQGTEALAFDICSGSGSFSVRIPAYGNHLALAALAATAAAKQLGMSDGEICGGLLSYKPVDGRANPLETGAITIIDDCYNANPNSVSSALASLSALAGRRVAILGDMLDLGGQSELLHREIGTLAAQGGVDSLICCGDKAAHIYEAFVSAGGGDAWRFPAKSELIAALPELIKKGDAVLIKASHGMKFEELLPYLKEL